jgi:potassium uptake TrkH family protein
MIGTGILTHPARAVPASFLLAMLIGTALLMLPWAAHGPGGAPFVTALFTATSAVCVTGLVVVDTPVFWTPFGVAVILLLIQVGGFGIMTGATLLGLLVSRRLPLRRRILAQAETRSLELGDVTGLLKLVAVVTLSLEAVVAVLLTIRLVLGYGEPLPQAAWHGLFHAVSAFNNAGFSTYSDNLVGFASDPLMLSPVMLAIIIGGIGFPVLYELRRELRQPSSWSVHTKITLLGTLLLLVGGFSVILAYEWTNPRTLGPLSVGEKFLGALFHAVQTRTAGFNSLDVGQLRSETLVISEFLMFVGGGSAGTAGGIKITTFLLLGFVVWAEIRGEQDVTAFRRRITSDAQRDALTIVLLSLAAVTVGTLTLLSVSELPLEAVLFEAVSAFATVGLSTGITAKLPEAGQLVLVALMFLGRVGTITVATALALRPQHRPYRYPEERPIVG